MKNNKTIKLPEEFWDFLNKIITNRIKTDVDKYPLYKNEASMLIVKYFKENNDRYLELIKLGEKDV